MQIKQEDFLLLFIYVNISADIEILSIGFVPLKISSIGQNTGSSLSKALIILKIPSTSAIKKLFPFVKSSLGLIDDTILKQGASYSFAKTK